MILIKGAMLRSNDHIFLLLASFLERAKKQRGREILLIL